MHRFLPILPIVGALAVAPAAHAGDRSPRQKPPVHATSVPEPDTLVMFLMGAAGLVIGRRLSRAPNKAASRD